MQNVGSDCGEKIENVENERSRVISSDDKNFSVHLAT